MSKKWFGFLALWYMLWSLVSSVYTKKTGKTFKKDLEKSDYSFKLLFENFVDMHKELLLDVKEELTSEKNKEIYEKYKNQIIEIFENYKEKWEILLSDLNKNWKKYLDETLDNLKVLYKEKIKELDSLKWLSKEKTEKLKWDLTMFFDKMKKQMKKVGKKK